MLDADKKLGKKIRELRQQRGITQKELAGDKITRNMLSLIENGAASPSVSTLLYISDKLGTPAGYFFSSTTEDEGRFYKLTVIENLKEAFRQKKYRECEEMCDSIPSAAIDDELSFILAYSYIKTAVKSAEEHNMRAAVFDFDKAAYYTSRSIYCGDAFNTAIEFYNVLIRNSASELIPDALCSFSSVSEFVPSSEVEYFASLRIIKSGETAPFTFARGSYYETHINSLILIRDGKLNEAQKKLREFSLDANAPYFMQYRVLCDLENTANTLGDVRLAYSASRRKLELIEKFKI